jgi:hypothetical protein
MSIPRAIPPVVFGGNGAGAKGGAENLYPLLVMKMLAEQVGVPPQTNGDHK